MTDEVTQWLVLLGDGDERAAQAIWEKYFDKLVVLARRQMEGLPLRVADEEDVALSAMKSFCRGMAAGRYPQLKDRHDLWKLLVTITCHKAVNQARRVRAQKRGGGQVRGESVFRRPDDASSGGAIGQVMGEAPSPEFASMMFENCRELLDHLGDDTLKIIALCRMEGDTIPEIARKLDYTVRTVERKLARIREKWARESEEG